MVSLAKDIHSAQGNLLYDLFKLETLLAYVKEDSQSVKFSCDTILQGVERIYSLATGPTWHQEFSRIMSCNLAIRGLLYDLLDGEGENRELFELMLTYSHAIEERMRLPLW